MSWQPLPSKSAQQPLARSSHTLTSLNSKLYLFGGENQPRTPIDNVLWAYDLDTNCWTEVSAEGDLPVARLGHTAAAAGGKLYIYGGRVGVELGEHALDDFFCFDPETNKWSRVLAGGDLPGSRSYHAMASSQGKIYLFGGCGKSGRLNDLYEFDPATSTWTQLPSSPTIKGRGGAGLVATVDGGALHVVAGFCGEEMSDTHVFDVAKKTWQCPSCCEVDTSKQLPPRSVFGIGAHACAGACQHGQHILLFGGEVDPSTAGHAGAGMFSNDTFCLDTQQGPQGWHRLPTAGEVPPPRGWFAATAVPGGFVVHGGNTPQNVRLGDMYMLKLHEP